MEGFDKFPSLFIFLLLLGSPNEGWKELIDVLAHNTQYLASMLVPAGQQLQAWFISVGYVSFRAKNNSAGSGLLPPHADGCQHLAWPSCTQVPLSSCFFIFIKQVCVCFLLINSVKSWFIIILASTSRALRAGCPLLLGDGLNAEVKFHWVTNKGFFFCCTGHETSSIIKLNAFHHYWSFI